MKLKDFHEEFKRNCERNWQASAKSNISLRDAIFGEQESVESILSLADCLKDRSQSRLVAKPRNTFKQQELMVIHESSEIINISPKHNRLSTHNEQSREEERVSPMPTALATVESVSSESDTCSSKVKKPLTEFQAMMNRVLSSRQHK